MTRTDSMEIKRLSRLTKHLDAAIQKTAQVKQTCTDTLRVARRAGLVEHRKVQNNVSARKKVR